MHEGATGLRTLKIAKGCAERPRVAACRIDGQPLANNLLRGVGVNRRYENNAGKIEHFEGRGAVVPGVAAAAE